MLKSTTQPASDPPAGPTIADRCLSIYLGLIRARLVNEAVGNALNSKRLGCSDVGEYNSALRDDLERIQDDFNAVKHVLERLEDTPAPRGVR